MRQVSLPNATCACVRVPLGTAGRPKHVLPSISYLVHPESEHANDNDEQQAIVGPVPGGLGGQCIFWLLRWGPGHTLNFQIACPTQIQLQDIKQCIWHDLI